MQLYGKYSTLFLFDPPTQNALYIENVTISTTGILKLLNELNIYKACGPDGINARILKETGDFIAPILRVIFQLSLDTGIVPDD